MKVGDIVYTLKSCAPKGYLPDARRYNRWGVKGKILRVSTGHGLCYEVLHGGVSGWYEPEELSLVSPETTTPVLSETTTPETTVWERAKNGEL